MIQLQFEVVTEGVVTCDGLACDDHCQIHNPAIEEEAE